MRSAEDKWEQRLEEWLERPSMVTPRALAEEIVSYARECVEMHVCERKGCEVLRATSFVWRKGVMKNLLPVFVEFSRLQMYSTDVDTIYPVLRHLQRGMTLDSALWHTILATAFYNVPAAHYAFSLQPHPGILPPEAANQPIGVVRRGLRGGNLNRHLASWAELAREHGYLSRWITGVCSDSPKINWRLSERAVQVVFGNGRWAGYKMAELFQKVHGLNIEAPDIGNPPSKEVLSGAAFFGTEPYDTSWRIHELLHASGVKPAPDIAEVESLFCDFYHLTTGTYYPGFGIDRLQTHLLEAQARGVPEPLLKQIYEARRAVIPNEWLGELNGWQGIDKPRKKTWKETGQLLKRP